MPLLSLSLCGYLRLLLELILSLFQQKSEKSGKRSTHENNGNAGHYTENPLERGTAKMGIWCTEQKKVLGYILHSENHGVRPPDFNENLVFSEVKNVVLMQIT